MKNNESNSVNVLCITSPLHNFFFIRARVISLFPSLSQSLNPSTIQVQFFTKREGGCVCEGGGGGGGGGGKREREGLKATATATTLGGGHV